MTPGSHLGHARGIRYIIVPPVYRRDEAVLPLATHSGSPGTTAAVYLGPGGDKSQCERGGRGEGPLEFLSSHYLVHKT